MSDPTQVFDFENLLPDAVASVFNANGFNASNALTANSDPEFTKKRPRVEIVFNLIGQASPIRYHFNGTNSDGSPILRNAAWRGELVVHAITDADIPGKLVHAQFRSAVRNLMQLLMYKANGVTLLNHKIQQMVEGATQHGIRTQDGHEQSSLHFVLDFSVQEQAWQLLS